MNARIIRLPHEHDLPAIIDSRVVVVDLIRALLEHGLTVRSMPDRTILILRREDKT